MKLTSLLLAAACLVGATSCAGDYVARTADLRKAYEARDYDRALALVAAEEKQKSEKDRLLVLLDKGMVLHAAGRCAESNAALAEADRLAASLDVVSVSEEATAFVSTERNKAFRGEDFERLTVSVLMALNYAQLAKQEDALVEARRVNERMLKMIRDEKKPYEQLAVARYLSGALYEDAGDLEGAFLDYRTALELCGLDLAAEPLLRVAARLGRSDEVADVRKRFPAVAGTPSPDDGEVLVVVENGLSPQKVPVQRASGKTAVTVPLFQSRSSPSGGAGEVAVDVDGRKVQARRMTSLEAVAEKHLEERLSRLTLKSAASVDAKSAAAKGLGRATNSDAVATVSGLLLQSNTAPDLRSWLSLPAEFQVARLEVPPGTHRLSVDTSGGPLVRTVEVKAGRIAVVALRRY